MSGVPTITCPRCLMRSANPGDILHGYCGNCHDYTSTPAATLTGMQHERPIPDERRLADLINDVRIAAGAVASHRAALTEAVAAFGAVVRDAYAAGISEAALNAALVDFDEIHPLPPEHPSAGGVSDANGEPFGDHPPWGVVLSVLTDQWIAMCYLCGWRGEPAERNADAQPELRSHLNSERHARSMEGGA